jgi:cbb3-type cytochrome oxidase cytochrome c subunit
MNRGPVIFFSAFVAFAISFFGFVLMPQVQVGRLPLTTVVGSTEVYPAARPGQAAQGAQIYRANGCAACHSQQVRQTGVTFDLLLTDAGSNKPVVVGAICDLNSHTDAIAAKTAVDSVPQTVLRGLATKAEAEVAQKTLKAAGAKSDILVVPFGSDVARGWGARRTVAADYLFDAPVQLGSQRVGPDLANVGLRSPDANWHLLHLYNAQIYAKGSPMPPYRYLFITRKIGAKPSPDALVLPAGFEPKPGYEVVPTDAARALVAYLQSLNSAKPLYEAPMAAAAK